MSSVHSSCLTLLATLAFINRASCQDGAPIFDNAQYFVGRSPQELVTVDLNGDGRLDLITANRLSHDVSVLLANGAGGFAVAAHYPAPGEPRALALGDCNEDGATDVVVACYAADGFAVLLGGGDGSFGPPLGFSAGTAPTGIALADFDRDGHLDAATADSGINYSVSICFGDGQGGFSPQTFYHAGLNPSCVVAGDFNSDGWIDIAAFDEPAGVSILLNTQAGLFNPATTYGAGTSPRRSLQVADVTGDGVLDLVMVGGLISGGMLLVGNGDGSFQSMTNVGTGGTLPLSVTVGDLNNDGIDDVAGFGTAPSTMRISWGSTSGNLVPGPSILIAGEPLDAVIGDFNQDGIVEVATANGNLVDNVTILLRDAQGRFHPPPRYPMEPGAHGLIAGDWNGDGVPDLATAEFSDPGKIWTTLNDGAGGFLPASAWPVGNSPGHLATADLDQDGILDIVASNSTGHSLSILKGVAGGNFSSGGTLQTGGLNTSGVGIADLDSNGWLDLVCANSNSGDVTVFLGTGLGNFSPGIRYASGSSPVTIAVGDLDGNMTLDLAVTNSESPSAVFVLSGDGTGAFQVSQFTPVSPLPHRLAMTDLNQDGRQDLLVTCAIGANAHGLLEILIQDPTGLFQPAGSYLVGGQVVNLALGDLNADGLIEAVTASGLSNNVKIFPSDGQGGFQNAIGHVIGGATTFGCVFDPIALAIADYDLDGRQDIATVGVCGGNAIAILLNRLTGDPGVPMCFGGGIASLCPCNNSGLAGHGCENSGGSGGAVLASSGQANLSGDTVILTSSGELPTSLTIFIQGSAYVHHASFGDGLRCVGGAIKRLYTTFASGGVASAPQSGSPAVSVRSALLGDQLFAGSIRVYQAYYRDPQLGFCPNPVGNSFNVSSGQQLTWLP